MSIEATLPTTGGAWSWARAGGVAVRDMGPVVLALAPLGLVVGLTVAQTGIGPLLGVGGAPAIYAGTAQLSLLTLLASGAGIGAVVASVAVINARLVMYAAVLEPHFRGQPRWFRWLAPHWIVEQTFVLVTARDDLRDATRFRRYWLTLGGALALTWTGLVALGVVAGPVLADAAPVLAFAPAAVFLSMLVPRVTDRPALAAAGTAGVVTGGLTVGGTLPAGIPVLIGAAAGIAAALLAQGRAS
jgi:predicted branched-subunit amino acid permease